MVTASEDTTVRIYSVPGQAEIPGTIHKLEEKREGLRLNATWTPQLKKAPPRWAPQCLARFDRHTVGVRTLAVSFIPKLEENAGKEPLRRSSSQNGDREKDPNKSDCVVFSGGGKNEVWCFRVRPRRGNRVDIETLAWWAPGGDEAEAIDQRIRALAAVGYRLFL